MPAELDEIALASLLARCDELTIAGAVGRLGDDALDRFIGALGLAASVRKPVDDVETTLRELEARVVELRGRKP